MKLMRVLFVLGVFAGLSACGKPSLTCDEPSPYQLAAEGKRMQAPDDLDTPESIKAIPLPDASPTNPRPAGSPCLDLPPGISVSK